MLSKIKNEEVRKEVKIELRRNKIIEHNKIGNNTLYELKKVAYIPKNSIKL